MINEKLQAQKEFKISRDQQRAIAKVFEGGYALDLNVPEVAEALGGRSGNRFVCPITGLEKLEFNKNNGSEFSCFDKSIFSQAEYKKALRKILMGEFHTPAAFVDGEIKRLDISGVSAPRETLSANSFNNNFRSLIKTLKSDISPANKQREVRLAIRGVNSDQFAWFPAYEYVRIGGRDKTTHFVAINHEGRLVGAQLAPQKPIGFDQLLDTYVAQGDHAAAKKLKEAYVKPWCTRFGTTLVTETGETPVTLARPPIAGIENIADATRDQLDAQSIVLTNVIRITESICDKPWITALRFNCLTIGSAKLGTEPKSLKAMVDNLTELKPDAEFRLCPDAGAVNNPQVISKYCKTYAQLKSIGHEVNVEWWGQYTKADGDIDTISQEVRNSIAVISFEEFLTKINNSDIRAAALKLIQTEIKKHAKEPILTAVDKEAVREANKTDWKAEQKAEDERNLKALNHIDRLTANCYSEQFVKPIHPQRGQITFVTSPCGTGKTTALVGMIAEHKAKYPMANVIVLIHRRSLKANLELKLGIADYKTSKKDWDAKEQKGSMVTCVDSLFRLNPSMIQPNTLVIIDESEAVLNHMTSSSTLGRGIAKTQKLFEKLLQNVIANQGSIVCLEDSLTNISIEGYKSLINKGLEHEVKTQLIINNQQRFKIKFNFYRKEKANFIAQLINKTQNNGRGIVLTSSKNFSNLLLEMIKEIVKCEPNSHLVEVLDKTIVINADTASNHKDFLTDPNSYLANNDVRLLICSPTIESGFSIDDENYFTFRACVFQNNETRSHIQAIYRLRSNVETDVYVQERVLGDTKVNKRWWEQMSKTERVAKNTFRSVGVDKASDAPTGETWNRLAAQFAARAKLSTDNSYSTLSDELRERGHEVVDCTEYTVDNDPNAITGARIKSMARMLNEWMIEEAAETKDKLGTSNLDVSAALEILNNEDATVEQRHIASNVMHCDRLGISTDKFKDLGVQHHIDLRIRDKGAYLTKIEKKFIYDNPSLALNIEFDSVFNATKSNKLHVVYSKLTKIGRLSKLISPIMDKVNELVELAINEDKQTNEWNRDHHAVIAVHEYMMANKWEFRDLTAIKVVGESVGASGQAVNTPVCLVNKLIRSMGYKTESRTVATKNGSDRVFTITNTKCLHREFVEKCLMEKYKKQLDDGYSECELLTRKILTEVVNEYKAKPDAVSKLKAYLEDYHQSHGLLINTAQKISPTHAQLITEILK